MDFKFSKEQENFRQEVREFYRKEPWGEIVSELDFLAPSLQRKIGEKGWLGIAFPKAYNSSRTTKFKSKLKGLQKSS